MNFPQYLKDQGIVQNNLVAIDYVSSNDDDMSSFRFGSFDTQKVPMNQFYEIPNAGHHYWTLQLDQVSFNDRVLADSSEKHIAFIDTGNTTI